MDWENKVKQLIANYFLSFEIQYDVRKKTTHNILIDFLNLKMKLIKPVQRQVYKSDRFGKLQIPYETLLALISIDKKIRNGEDITFHMSKQVLNPSYNDLLLNTWVIQHIHISRTKKNKSNKFYDRSDFLLFAIFSENAAYFLDIQNHKAVNVFSKQNYLKIIDENWPELLDDYDINKNGDKTRAFDYTDQEIREITKKGYSIGLINIGDRTISCPGIGITTSGHNIQIVRQADHLFNFLHKTNIEIKENQDYIISQLKITTSISNMDLSLRITEYFPFFEFFEINSGTILRP